MKNSIIFQNHGGQDEMVFVRLEMNSYYKEFLETIPSDGSTLEERFTAVTQCIVWGAFYLEATINRVVQMIWKTARMASLGIRRPCGR